MATASITSRHVEASGGSVSLGASRSVFRRQPQHLRRVAPRQKGRGVHSQANLRVYVEKDKEVKKGFMKNLILIALDKAKRLTDEELREQIAQLESGKKKLRLRDERGRALPLSPMILAVYRRVQEERKKACSE